MGVHQTQAMVQLTFITRSSFLLVYAVINQTQARCTSSCCEEPGKVVYTGRDPNPPKCSETRRNAQGLDYSGTEARTAAGLMCQEWNRNGAHVKPKPELWHKKGKRPPNHNYCRNPDEDKRGPWCYIKTWGGPKSRTQNWGTCDIKICPEPTCSEPRTLPPPKSADWEPICGRPCLCGSACGNTARDIFNLGKSCNIVGGEDSEFGELPWQVGIRRSNDRNQNIFCGGTIINRFHILTAAHCLYKKRDINELDTPMRNLEVLVGFHKRVDPNFDRKHAEYGQGVHKVAKITKHHLYRVKGASAEYDVAILKLKTPVRYHESIHPDKESLSKEFSGFSLVRPVCIASPKYWNSKITYNDGKGDDYSLCQVSGYGRISTDAPNSKQNASVLKKCIVDVHDPSYCLQSLCEIKQSPFYRSDVCDTRKLPHSFMCGQSFPASGKDELI